MDPLKRKPSIYSDLENGLNVGQRLPFTAHLASEHVLIMKMLDLFRALANDLSSSPERRSKELLELLAILRLALGDVHHHKEEEIFFPHVEEMTPLQQGGPRCTFFMTHLLVDDLGRKIEAEAKILGLTLPPLSPFITELSEKNSPLMIPIQEHWAGTYALDMLELILTGIQNGERARLTDCFLLASRFERMMRLHIEKEDTCLFIVADQFLPEDFQANLLARYETEHPDDVEKMNQAYSDFEQLSRRSGHHG